MICVRFVFVRVRRLFPIRPGLGSELDGEQVIRKEWVDSRRSMVICGDCQGILQLADPLAHRENMLMELLCVG